nr:transposase family protein [Actinomyces oris]
MRHSLFTVLSLAVTGVLAGCRSLTAIWEHATDLTPSDLRSLGLEAGQALPSAVIHPAGAAGSGPHRPQHPSEVVVVHSYRRRRGKNGHCGGRVRPCAQPAWGRPRRRTSCRPWATPRVLSLSRHVWRTSPTRSPPSGSFSSPSTWTGWW